MVLRLLQGRAADGARFVIAAEEERAYVLEGVESVRALASRAIRDRATLAEAVAVCVRKGAVDIAAEDAAGRLLSPIDHDDPARITLSGTGLTHLGSAEGRDKMHREAVAASAQTDSMRMFLEGIAGGKPAPGRIGQQPEWFYKGDGAHLAAPGADLEMPAFAQDGGEEPELAGVYMIGPDGTPYRLGLCLGNEFSDHVMERHNYLWLAHSKLRQAAIGPELLIGAPPAHIEGVSRVLRRGGVVWEKPFLTGEANMSHSLENLEAHHFKYAQFRRPGDVHVHFFGTATLSYSDGVRTEPGDIFEIAAAPFALPLRNRLIRSEETPVKVAVL